MKTSFVAVALSLATFSSAQFGLPKCANSCFLPALKSDGCGLTDFKCHCQQDDLIPKIQPCVESKCTSGEQQQILTAVEGLCAKQGVSISISAPSSATATSSSGSSTSISDTTTFSHPYITSTPKGNSTATFTKPTLTKPTTGMSTTKGPSSSGSSSSGGASSTDAPGAAPTTAFGGLVAAVAGVAVLAAGL